MAEPRTPDRVRGVDNPRYITPREKQVFLMYVSGYSAEQIASTLRISPATVNGHLRNVTSRWGMRRISLLAVGIREGIFDVEDIPPIQSRLN